MFPSGKGICFQIATIVCYCKIKLAGLLESRKHKVSERGNKGRQSMETKAISYLDFIFSYKCQLLYVH